jgi:hypothetical protein
MAPELIERVHLQNGLVLELWDQSRPLAGDRWFVSLLAKVEIPVRAEYFSTVEEGEQAYQDLVAAYGNPITFTQEKVRHFVDEKDIKATLATLCQRFKDNLVSYLANPKFASLFALKKYGDLQDRQKFCTRAPEK